MVRSLAWKAFLGLGTLVILWSLATERPTQMAKQDRLRVALKQGTIGRLGVADEFRLDGVVRMAAEAAGIHDVIAVDQPYQPGRLHVYVSTPASKEVTGCGRANAVFDWSLDSVFIDREVFKPEDLPALAGTSQQALASDELSFASVYLQFILLHEFGHRQLRHGSEPIIDRFIDSTRRLEKEADRFAIDSLWTLYRHHPSQLSSESSGLLTMLGLKDTVLSERERFWVL